MNLRIVSLPAHGAVELLLGMLTMVAPFLIGATPAGTVVLAGIGAVVVGLALTTVDDASVAVHAHHTYDLGLAVGLLGAAVALAAAGDAAATTYAAIAGVVHLGLNLVTRYSAR